MATILSRLIVISVMYQILATHFSPSIFCSAAKKVSAIFIFGDSLVDVGNNFYIDTSAMPECPNGIDFVNGCPSGRYTNDRTFLDIIEEELGFNYSPPYLAPNTTGDVILKGVNYASAGSGILNSTGRIYNARICMDVQISNFAKTRQDIISRIGKPAARRLLRKALYFLITGSNDILFERISETKHGTQYVDEVVSRFKSQLTTLYNLDARKIVVTNCPPLGCMPFSRDTGLRLFNCVSTINDLAKLYNSRLKTLLQELTTRLSSSRFVYADSYAILEDILNNYRSYGFENADSACCRVLGLHGGLFACGHLSRVCPDRTKIVFWDPFHPTDTANLILAKHALDGGFEYISPMNIRQLANS